MRCRASPVSAHRRREHLKTLRDDTDKFLERKPFRVAVEFERDTGWHVAVFQIIEEPPPRLSVLVGEFAYECISALNHLTWELAARKMGRNRVFKIKRSVQFPVSLSDHKFLDQTLVQKRFVSKPALAVLERLQPYSGVQKVGGPRNQPSWLIKEIADSDKHRVLTSTFAELHFDEVVWYWDETRASGPLHEQCWDGRSPLKHGTRLARIRFESGNAEANVDVDRQPGADIRFNTDTWSIRERDLWNCGAWLNWAIAQFEPLFPSP